MSKKEYALVACPITGQVEFARIKCGKVICPACGATDHDPDTQEPPF